MFILSTYLQLEHLSPGCGWRLRTAEGWVSQRSVDDPDTFFLERLQHETCPFVRVGVGPERCVFIDSLRAPSMASIGNGGSEGVSSVPHPCCEEILVGPDYAEVVTRSQAVNAAEKRGSLDGHPPSAHGASTRLQAPVAGAVTGGSAAAIFHSRPEPPLRSLLTPGVQVGDADGVTFVIELFVPPALGLVQANPPGDGAPIIGAAGRADLVSGARDWRWGVWFGDFDVYLSMRPCRVDRQGVDNGGNVGSAGQTTAASTHAGGAVLHADRLGERGGALHVVIDGPGGFNCELPVPAAFVGRWMTLKIVAHRPGESLLLCTPGSGELEHTENARVADGGTGVNAKLKDGDDSGDNAVGTAVSFTQGHLLSLKCTFSNPRFFRGDRVGDVGLYSKRATPESFAHAHLLPFRARHAVVLLGTTGEFQPPPLSRLRHLEHLVAVDHAARLTEPAARPLLIFTRRLRRLWSGDVLPSAAAPGEATESGTDRGASPPTLTVWEPLLCAGRVALGSAVFLSRGGGNNPDTVDGNGGGVVSGGEGKRAATAGAIVESRSVNKRCLTAWEHPALQTPARFEPVPLPPVLSSQRGIEGDGLWAWAPVPRSKSYLAVGLTFTTGPEPPPPDAARCVLRELVKDAEPQKCKVSMSIHRDIRELYCSIGVWIVLPEQRSRVYDSPTEFPSSIT